MDNSIFIPKRIRVGFQSREDTYTKMLAYVIYYDQKGKLRKETSWESWRDKSIDPADYDNEPTDGFVLNKKVGGYASHWGDFRQSYVRVYDPRGFEFEITVPNLLYILEQTSSIKGKGLEGKFVYGWNGTELVLIPVCSPDYKELTELNNKRFSNQMVKARDLQIGATYLTSGNQQVVYMGRFHEYGSGYSVDGQAFPSYSKARQYANKMGLAERVYRHIDGIDKGNNFFFYYREHSDWSSGFQARPSISRWLIDVVSEEPATDYAELFGTLESQKIYSPYDNAKDQYIQMPFDDFVEFAKSIYSPWGREFICQWRGEYKRVQIQKVSGENNGYICTDPRDSSEIIGDFPRSEKQISFFGTRTVYEMIPASLEEIYKRLPIYYKDEYLSNGKFYRRVTSL